jgi:steroid 5-alpha reductase family enzyme
MNFSIILVAVLAQWAVLAAVMASAFVIQQRTGNSGFIDAVWTFGLGTVGIASALAPISGAGVSGRQLLVAFLILLWSARLGTHIVRRSLARADDPRYAALIRQWGFRARRELFLLVQKQAIVTVPLALSLFVAAHNPAPLLRVQDAVAVALVLLGIAGEGIADRQLRAFVASPHKTVRVCDRGLWAWSRHPNYFFEWLFWLALPLLAIDLGGGYAVGWLALLAPACIYCLLVHVSGIPPLEEHMVKAYGAAYRAYQERTSAFIPLPPKVTR